MVAFTFGKPFPLHNKANGTEYCRADFNDSFFDICYYFPDVDERYINASGKGKDSKFNDSSQTAPPVDK